MTDAQAVLSHLAAEFGADLLALQARAAADPDVALALFPDLEPEPTGSNAWLAYMEYGSDERGNWPPAAIVAADGSVSLEYEDATLAVLPPVKRLAREPSEPVADLTLSEEGDLPF